MFLTADCMELELQASLKRDLIRFLRKRREREEETCCRALGDDERDPAGGYELSYCKQRKRKADEDEKRRENFCSLHFSRAC